jgi:hypothetical protein
MMAMASSFPWVSASSRNRLGVNNRSNKMLLIRLCYELGKSVIVTASGNVTQTRHSNDPIAETTIPAIETKNGRSLKSWRLRRSPHGTRRTRRGAASPVFDQQWEYLLFFEMFDGVQQFTGAGITLEGQRLEDRADTILNPDRFRLQNVMAGLTQKVFLSR